MITTKRFSDLNNSTRVLEGDKIKIGDVAGKEIIIKGFSVSESKFKEEKLLTLQIEMDGVNRVVFTGSKVLADQCEENKDEMPFMTKIERINNKYYTFT